MISQITGSGSATYARSDGLESIRLLTDGAGSVVGSQEYDAFGASRSQSGVQLPFGFTGEQVDAESGLVYLRARYYDTAQGRFLTQDPLGLGGGDINLYRSVHGSPVDAMDPNGLADMFGVGPGGGGYGGGYGGSGFNWEGAIGALGAVGVAAAGGAFDGVLGGAVDVGRAAANGAEVACSAAAGLFQSHASTGRKNLPFADSDRVNEINKTLDRMEQGGPFPYPQDGIEFQNREGKLPQKGPGYFKEYTVDTPGIQGRGVRRIAQGQGGETYYTDDHYETFVQIGPKRHQ